MSSPPQAPTTRPRAAMASSFSRRPVPLPLGSSAVPAGLAAASSALTWRPSDSRMSIPNRLSPAPPISMRWVGPQSVTSCPKSRWETSSSGKPMSANAPQPMRTSPPTGTCQSRVSFTALAPGRFSGSTSARKPAANRPKSPKSMK